MIQYPAYRVAAMHVSPVFLDAEKTTEKACSLIAEAARAGARLVAFPETYIPAFPVWSALRAPILNHRFFKALAANAIRVPGPEVARISAAARKAGVVVSMGINEGTDASVGCIWNSNLLIGEDGRILNHHRKIVPTFWEKLVWANGDGAGLRVVDTPLGRIGMLICGENTNPLARFALMAEGEQVHISTYPPVWPANDPRERNAYDVANAIRIRAGAHSFEAKAFNIVAASYMDEAMKDALSDSEVQAREILEASPRGLSMVISPSGSLVGEPMQAEEGILYADIDVSECVVPKQIHDVVGYYNRFDIFKLTVNRSANRPVAFEDDGASREHPQVTARAPRAEPKEKEAAEIGLVR
jgi:nitrilase